MNDTLLGFLVALIAITATGTGISIGWVMHANYVKAHPSGIESVAKMAAQQFTAIERGYAGALQKVEEANAATIGNLQMALTNLSYNTARPGASAPPPAAAQMSDADAAARAVGEKTSDRQALRDMLMARGLDGASADAVLDHRYDDIPPGTVLAELADLIVAERTGLV